MSNGEIEFSYSRNTGNTLLREGCDASAYCSTRNLEFVDSTSSSENATQCKQLENQKCVDCGD